MITQRCPKCRSNRIRRGYRHTSIVAKLVFRYNLLCDSCNWEFNGFAIPFEINTGADSKKQIVQEKVSGGITRTNEYWSESVARDSQSHASQYADLETMPIQQAADTALTSGGAADLPDAKSVSTQKGQRSKRSKKRTEKLAKSAGTTVTSRSASDNIANKRTSSVPFAVEKTETANGTVRSERKGVAVKQRVAATKAKGETSRSVAARDLSSAGLGKLKSKPKTAKASGPKPSKPKNIGGKASLGAAEAKEPVKAAAKSRKVVRTAGKKPAARKPVKKSSATNQ